LSHDTLLDATNTVTSTLSSMLMPAVPSLKRVQQA